MTKVATDTISGKSVRSFVVNSKVYELNAKSDRDKDGIACEMK